MAEPHARTLEDLREEIRIAISRRRWVQLEEVLSEARERSEPILHADVLWAESVIARSNEDFEQALSMQEHARQQYLALRSPRDAAAMIGGLGATYFMIGDYDQAIAHYTKEFEVQEGLGNEVAVGLCLTDLGHVATHTGHYPEAMEYTKRGYDIALRHDRDDDALRALSLIGLIRACVGDLDGARSDYERAIALGKQTGNDLQVAILISNIGDIESRCNNHLRAGELHQQGVELTLRSSGGVGESAKIKELICNAAFEFGQGGDFQQALKLLAKVNKAEINEPWTLALYELANGYIGIHQGDTGAATDAFTRALEAATMIKELEMESHKGLREAALLRNDLQAYVRHNDEYTAIGNEIRGSQTAQRIAVQEKDRELEIERQKQQRERDILYATLPDHVADRLVRGEDVSGDHFNNASVLFLDIVGFTSISDRIPPGHVVHLLKAIFRVCDEVCKRHGLTKVKTIGDSYLAVAGVPEPLEDHTQRAAQAAMDMMQGLNELELTMDPMLGDTSWTQEVGEVKVRIGLHCGPVVAGIVGDERLQYDIWGDTVNTASRMESTGEPGRIQVSSAFADQLWLLRSVAEEEPASTANSNSQQQLRERGAIEVKGKGSMKTYWLE